MARCHRRFHCGPNMSMHPASPRGSRGEPFGTSSSTIANHRAGALASSDAEVWSATVPGRQSSLGMTFTGASCPAYDDMSTLGHEASVSESGRLAEWVGLHAKHRTFRRFETFSLENEVWNDICNFERAPSLCCKERAGSHVLGDGMRAFTRCARYLVPGVLVIFVMSLGKPCVASRNRGTSWRGCTGFTWRGICARGPSRANRSYK
jgi:hypothetical protein